MILRLVLLIILIPATSFLVCAQFILTSPAGISEVRQNYTYNLLVAALNATNTTNEQVIVEKVPINAGYSASTFVVKNGQADVTYFPTNQEIERQLIPIRVPLYKGLMGYRILLIQSKAQAKFDAITSLDELKKLVQGAGSRWRTTKVLEHHQFNYVTAIRTSSLYKMLELGRFDYTTRGVIEIPDTALSIEKHFPTLKMEDNFLLYTELPVYFFVAKNKPELAKRIEEGMVKIANNGQFDAIFNAYYQTITGSIELKNRTIFHLENPFLSPKTIENAKTFWQQQVQKPLF